MSPNIATKRDPAIDVTEQATVSAAVDDANVPKGQAGCRPEIPHPAAAASDSTQPQIVARAVPDQAQLQSLDSPLLRRIYAGRGVRDVTELDYRLSDLPHFSSLKGIETATSVLAETISARRPIRIVGDFDADGATSTALALEVLKAFGADADFFIPQRAVHGYGLSPAVVDAIGTAGQGGVILTVDNGIASSDGVAAAHRAHWQVVITDHHLPGEKLPDADAIVNPNQSGCQFESKSLAGVGVVFYVMAALRAHMAACGHEPLPHMAALLDLVAIGTVADVVPLDRVNRTLVSQGLRRIRAGRGRPGIAALAEAAGRDYQKLNTEDVGFAIGPRLNAAGRLEDMRLGVACLRAVDRPAAEDAAQVLSSINRRRKSLQHRMQADAEAALEQLTVQEAEKPALVVHGRDWHEGIVGLVASRLSERMHRPVIAFAPGANGVLKGSARSIPGLHIRDVLAAVDAEVPGLLQRFGGHAQAAGLTLEPSSLSRFTQQFEAAVSARLTAAMRRREFLTDGELSAGEHNLATAVLLHNAGPWGVGFEAPLFHGLYHIHAQRVVGRGHLKLELQPAVGGDVVPAMFFNRTELLSEDRVHRMVFGLRVNEFRGRREANMIIVHQRRE